VISTRKASDGILRALQAPQPAIVLVHKGLLETGKPFFFRFGCNWVLNLAQLRSDPRVSRQPLGKGRWPIHAAQELITSVPKTLAEAGS
jgi:hypothetical protein